MADGLSLNPHSYHAPLPVVNSASAVADADVCTDDADLVDEFSGRSWEQQRQKIKAVEDKYRWKLNEHRVRIIMVVARCILLCP